MDVTNPVSLTIWKFYHSLPVKMLMVPYWKLLPVECPVKHIFTPGLYTREIFMPAGAAVVSKKHNTEHPFVISKGHVAVWDQFKGTVFLEAPYTGITLAGTQRVLVVIEDTIWTTFHVTNKTTVEEIEKDIIDPSPAQLFINSHVAIPIN